jgi:hypothetical protein
MVMGLGTTSLVAFLIETVEGLTVDLIGEGITLAGEARDAAFAGLRGAAANKSRFMRTESLPRMSTISLKYPAAVVEDKKDVSLAAIDFAACAKDAVVSREFNEMVKGEFSVFVHGIPPLFWSL